MELITCLNYRETISEKVIISSHCNFNLSQQNLIMCEDGETEYEIKLSAYPNSTIKQKIQRKKEL